MTEIIYNVHLYTLYRVKFAGIKVPGEQDNPEARADAVRLAMQLRHEEAVEIEDAEGMPIDALVDLMDPKNPTECAEEDEGQNFDIIPNGRLAPQIVANSRSRGMDAYAAAIELVKTLAGMTVEGDTVADEPYLATDNNEEVAALYSAVGQARKILGLPDAMEHA